MSLPCSSFLFSCKFHSNIPPLKIKIHSYSSPTPDDDRFLKFTASVPVTKTGNARDVRRERVVHIPSKGLCHEKKGEQIGAF